MEKQKVMEPSPNSESSISDCVRDRLEPCSPNVAPAEQNEGAGS